MPPSWSSKRLEKWGWRGGRGMQRNQDHSWGLHQVLETSRRVYQFLPIKHQLVPFQSIQKIQIEQWNACSTTDHHCTQWRVPWKMERFTSSAPGESFWSVSGQKTEVHPALCSRFQLLSTVHLWERPWTLSPITGSYLKSTSVRKEARQKMLNLTKHSQRTYLDKRGIQWWWCQ